MNCTGLTTAKQVLSLDCTSTNKLAMDLRLLCLLLVPLVTSRSAQSNPELTGHLKHIVRSANIGGYTFATLHAVDTNTNDGTAQTKRDIEAHASGSLSDKQSFSLHLASGERLRMSLKRRSIDTSGGTMTEITEDGRREVTRLQARGCFFSGPLDNGEGFASLAMCDGRLMGSVNTAKRYYEVHALPEGADKRSADDVTRVLVTWQDAAHAQEGMLAGDETMKRQILDKLEMHENDGIETPHDGSDDGQKRSISERTVTIEIANYLDSHYINGIKDKLNLTTTSQITDLMLNKWSAVANIFGDDQFIGWNITLKLVALEIWRINPSWYVTNASDSMFYRMDTICNGTKSLPYDQVTLHTGWPITHNGIGGLAWIGGVCMSRWHCIVILGGANTNYFTELHEFGHSLGLEHEVQMSHCASDTDPVRGFMQGKPPHFRGCYRQVLNATFT
ncbi:zinc metalloproteinase-disintegrin-like halysase [Littorina saxatilis]